MPPLNPALLPQWPARVEVTGRDGATRWLADRPGLTLDRVDKLADAGVFPWQEALQLAKAAHQPWRRQRARAVRVAERSAVGPEAQARAAGMGLAEPGAVRCLVFGPDRILVLRAGGREWLPGLAEVS